MLKSISKDKCKCGSGKKYKKCCLQKDLNLSGQELKDLLQGTKQKYFQTVCKTIHKEKSENVTKANILDQEYTKRLDEIDSVTLKSQLDMMMRQRSTPGDKAMRCEYIQRKISYGGKELDIPVIIGDYDEADEFKVYRQTMLQFNPIQYLFHTCPENTPKNSKYCSLCFSKGPLILKEADLEQSLISQMKKEDERQKKQQEEISKIIEDSIK